MRKPDSNKSSNGTSFHGTEIKATVNQLISILGEADYSGNDGEDKTNYEWVMELENGEIFTVYDWKEYRPIEDDEVISWHIGGRNSEVTEKAKKQMEFFIAHN